ncbi:MAG: hypothetical protein FVQ82_14975 [Planctomycetes bacterium]|nr:hypothetical protein [Planctomycetota bacterium]
MWKKRHSYILPFMSLIFAFVGGCSQKSQKSTWKPVWEVPPQILDYAMGTESEDSGQMLKRLDVKRFKRKYQGVIPRAFRDAEGNYRICLIKKDPLRDSYWYELFEFSADGDSMKAAMSSIPSSLKEPDPTKIPGW